MYLAALQSLSFLGQGTGDGFIDEVDPTTGDVHGWALDSANPSVSIEVEIHLDGAVFGRLLADQFRDFFGAAFPNHGWSFFMPPVYFDGVPHEIRVFAVTGTGLSELGNSPRVVTFGTVPSPGPTPAQDQAVTDLETQAVDHANRLNSLAQLVSIPGPTLGLAPTGSTLDMRLTALEAMATEHESLLQQIEAIVNAPPPPPPPSPSCPPPPPATLSLCPDGSSATPIYDSNGCLIDYSCAVVPPGCPTAPPVPSCPSGEVATSGPTPIFDAQGCVVGYDLTCMPIVIPPVIPPVISPFVEPSGVVPVCGPPMWPPLGATDEWWLVDPWNCLYQIERDGRLILGTVTPGVGGPETLVPSMILLTPPVGCNPPLDVILGAEDQWVLLDEAACEWGVERSGSIRPVPRLGQAPLIAPESNWWTGLAVLGLVSIFALMLSLPHR